MKVLVAEQVRTRSMDTGFYILESDTPEDILLYLDGYFCLGLDTYKTIEIGGSEVSITSHDLSAMPNGHAPNAAPMLFGVFNGIYADVVFIPENQDKADEAIEAILSFLSGGMWETSLVRTIQV